MPDIRSLYEKDYLGQWDVADNDLTLTIKSVDTEELLQPKANSKKKKVVMRFKETDKGMVLNGTNRDIIAITLGYGYDHTKWPGKKITLYKDAKVRFGSQAVGGLRIRPEVPSTKEIHCETEGCNGIIVAIGGMTAEQTAAYTKSKYGKVLCSECAKKAKAKLEGK